MITKYCTKCGSKWLVSNPNASECPKCDGALRGETNGDKIRAMNDEKLAEWINRLEPYKCHKGYKFVNGCWEDKTDCIACILEWLEQEAGT